MNNESREAKELRFERLSRLREKIDQELINLGIELQELDNDIDYARHIINRTSEFTNIPVGIMTNCTRKREVVDARRMAIVIIKKNTKLSLSQIGVLFKRDHATVIHALRTSMDICDTDKEYRRGLSELMLFVNAKN